MRAYSKKRQTTVHAKARAHICCRTPSAAPARHDRRASASRATRNTGSKFTHHVLSTPGRGVFTVLGVPVPVNTHAIATEGYSCNPLCHREGVYRLPVPVPPVHCSYVAVPRVSYAHEEPALDDRVCAPRTSKRRRRSLCRDYSLAANTYILNVVRQAEAYTACTLISVIGDRWVLVFGFCQSVAD